MAIIGVTDFYIGVPSLPRSQFKDYSTHLFDQWENHVEQNLRLSDYSLSLDVEEGSIKAVGKIATALGVLYLGIGQYGSFISGLQTISSQVRSVGDYFGDCAGAPFKGSNAKCKIRKRGESLARLQNLFVKVQRGEISVVDAMIESEKIFGAELDSVQAFKNELRSSLEKAPMFPKQLELLLVDESGELLLEMAETKKQQNPSPKQPSPHPPQELYRVEIWRDRKQGQRNIRVVNL